MTRGSGSSGVFQHKLKPLPWPLLFIFLFLTVAIAIPGRKRAEEAANESQ